MVVWPPGASKWIGLRLPGSKEASDTYSTTKRARSRRRSKFRSNGCFPKGSKLGWHLQRIYFLLAFSEIIEKSKSNPISSISQAERNLNAYFVLEGATVA